MEVDRVIYYCKNKKMLKTRRLLLARAARSSSSLPKLTGAAARRLNSGSRKRPRIYQLEAKLNEKMLSLSAKID